MEYKVCNIKGFEGLYWIYEDGTIYSVRKQRLLKPTKTGQYYKYNKVYLSTNEPYKGKWFGVHQLVIHHFICPKPNKQYEVNHKDLNKNNNHYTNLEWVTHQQNILHARQGISSWQSGRKPGFTPTEETRKKMSLKKMKKTLLFNDNQEIVCVSMTEAADKLNTNLRTVQRYVNSYRTFNGFKIKTL